MRYTNSDRIKKLYSGHLAQKKGYWYCVIEYTDELGRRKPKWISTGLPVKGNKAKAESFLQEQRRTFTPPAIEGATNLESNMLLTDYMTSWLQIAKATLTITTYGGYQCMITKKFIPYFSKYNVTLEALRPAMIQSFYLHELKTCSGTTVRHEHALLHKILDHAYKMELIDSNPADKVNPPKANHFEGAFYSEEEVAELLEKTKDHKLGLLIYVTVLLGLRRSEALGLRWQAIDFKQNTVTINHIVTETQIDGKTVIVAEDRTKTKSSYRTYPMGETLKAKLLEWKEVQMKNRAFCGKCYCTEYLDYVFTDEMGFRFKPRYVEDAFPKILEKNGLRKIRFHDLRHTCASLMHKKGLSLKEVQEYLGHSTISITMNLYTHIDWNDKKNAEKIMENTIILPENSSEKCVWEG